MFIRFLGAVLLIVLIFGIIAYSQGWLVFQNGRGSTNIEVKTDEIKSATEGVIEDTSKVLEDAGEELKESLDNDKDADDIDRDADIETENFDKSSNVDSNTGVNEDRDVNNDSGAKNKARPPASSDRLPATNVLPGKSTAPKQQI
jgi:hypothetical protein